MSKISRKKRQFEIRKKQKRRRKLKRLKERYFLSKTKEEKEKIIEKIRKIAPYISIDEFFKLKREEK